MPYLSASAVVIYYELRYIKCSAPLRLPLRTFVTHFISHSSFANAVMHTLKIQKNYHAQNLELLYWQIYRRYKHKLYSFTMLRSGHKCLKPCLLYTCLSVCPDVPPGLQSREQKPPKFILVKVAIINSRRRYIHYCFWHRVHQHKEQAVNSVNPRHLTTFSSFNFHST